MNGNFICAIRGPILMITLGVLLAIDQMGSFSFGRTWPCDLSPADVCTFSDNGAISMRSRDFLDDLLEVG